MSALDAIRKREQAKIHPAPPEPPKKPRKREPEPVVVEPEPFEEVLEAETQDEPSA